MRDAEVVAQRAITRAFIDADAEDVVINRSVRVPDGAGGWVRNPPGLLSPQRCRIIPSTSSRQVERTTLDGRVVVPSAILMGDLTLNVEIGDRFVRWGVEWEVVHVHERNEYQTKADIVRNG